MWVYIWNEEGMTIHKADLFSSAYYDKHCLYLAQVTIFQSRHHSKGNALKGEENRIS